MRSWCSKEAFELRTEELRLTNFVLLYLLLVALYVWTAITKREVHHEAVMQREFSVAMFPLFFFFSGLYYTDLLSALTVVVTYVFWSASQRSGDSRALYQALHLVSGLAALATRQTNVFWVAVYLGGLQVVKTVKREAGITRVHDPPMSEAFFEGQSEWTGLELALTGLDFLITSISMAQNGISLLPRLLVDLWPSLALLVSFAAFILYNGGVVLGTCPLLNFIWQVLTRVGDKSNHIAALHLPQLLYFFPFIVFFSWPVLLPLLSNPATLIFRLPRRATVAILVVAAILTVYNNTVIHPFLLADNRHYTFYVTHILFLRNWLVKYLATPIYIACGWLTIAILGGKARPRRGSVVATSKGRVAPDTVHVSWVLVWLISTALSLVTAPLIEPRYFIIPWLIWRLHVPEVFPSQPRMEHTESSYNPAAGQECKESVATTISAVRRRMQSLLRQLGPWSPHIEFAWYMTINLVTCWMFLYRPFEWLQEPGKQQRFMW